MQYQDILSIIIAQLLLLLQGVCGQVITHGDENELRKCYRPADIVLLLDSSGSIGIDNWRKELTLAGRLLHNFDISPKDSHVGIIDFSMVAKQHLDINKGRQDNAVVNSTLVHLNEDIHYQNGVTKTDLGLEMAVRMFKSSAENTERSAPRFLVLMTDGETTSNGNFVVEGYDRLTPKLMELKRLEVITYSVAIGNKPNEEALELLTGSRDHVIKVENFDALAKDMKRIIEIPCPPSGCNVKFEKLGCFFDNGTRPLESLVYTSRDPASDSYIGFPLNWFDYEEFLKKFICKCAEKAHSDKKKYIGIQYYGECWAGNGEDYARDGAADEYDCVNESFNPCGKTDQYCAGSEHINQVYSIQLGR